MASKTAVAPIPSVPQFSIEGDTLIIKMPLQDPTPSASGKTLVVASTHGNVQTPAMVNGKPVIIGLNAYIRA